VNRPEVEISDELVELAQVQRLIRDAALVLVLLEVSRGRSAKRALWPYPENRSLPGLF